MVLATPGIDTINCLHAALQHAAQTATREEAMVERGANHIRTQACAIDRGRGERGQSSTGKQNLYRNGTKGNALPSCPSHLGRG